MIGQSLLSQMLPASRDIRYGQGQMMGGGGDGRSSNPGWDAMTNAEKAAFYSDNPTMAGITQFGQQALNYAPFGIGMAMRAQQAIFPQFVADQQSVARGIDPGTGLQVGGYGSQPGTSGITPTGLYGDQFAGQQSTATGFFGGLAGRTEQAPAQVETRGSPPTVNFGKESSIPTGGIVSPGMDAGVYGGGGGAPGANADGFGGGDAGFGGGSKAFAQGGMVRIKDLLGKAPGPDDGYGALQDGEFVIKKDAVKRYGVKMLEQINRRKIAKKQVSKFFKNHG
jgi:hypothetical protein